jgi:hypothetical protein
MLLPLKNVAKLFLGFVVVLVLQLAKLWTSLPTRSSEEQETTQDLLGGSCRGQS